MTTAVKIPKVQDLQTEYQSAPTSVQSHSKPRASPIAAAVKTFKEKETKSDTQQILEELGKEMKQMFMAVVETSPRPMAPKQSGKDCKKCREEGKGENCMHCFKCGQKGHHC